MVLADSENMGLTGRRFNQRSLGEYNQFDFKVQYYHSLTRRIGEGD